MDCLCRKYAKCVRKSGGASSRPRLAVAVGHGPIGHIRLGGGIAWLGGRLGGGRSRLGVRHARRPAAEVTDLPDLRRTQLGRLGKRVGASRLGVAAHTGRPVQQRGTATQARYGCPGHASAHALGCIVWPRAGACR